MVLGCGAFSIYAIRDELRAGKEITVGTLTAFIALTLCPGFNLAGILVGISMLWDEVKDRPVISPRKHYTEEDVQKLMREIEELKR